MWKFTPEDNSFFSMMVHSSTFACQATQCFLSLVQNELAINEAMSNINRILMENKQLTNNIIERVGSSYITPIDREDIFDLVKAIQELVSISHATIERYKLYHLKDANPNVQRMAVLLHSTMTLIPDLIESLSGIRSHFKEITVSCNLISEREMEADYYYRHGLAELFETSTDAIEIIKWREILQHIEKSFDHCEKLADNIKEAVIKYV